MNLICGSGGFPTIRTNSWLSGKRKLEIHMDGNRVNQDLEERRAEMQKKSGATKGVISEAKAAAFRKNGGRPKSKKPSAAALAKRRSQAGMARRTLLLLLVSI